MKKAIDSSKYQGAVNWAVVKAAGIHHAMIRAGFGRYASQRDPQFDRSVAQCEANGIEWGAYWYSYATTAAEARQEARIFLQFVREKIAQGYKPTMPLAYDIEYEPGILALSNAQRTELVKAFLEEVEAAGCYGILYASKDFIQNRLNWRELTAYDVWCAQYSAACTCPLPYGMWQYSSANALGIPGFGKSLDCNRVYKDYPQLLDTLARRQDVYNETTAAIREKERRGEVFVIRPEAPLDIHRVEHDRARIQAVYDLGRAVMEKRLEAMKVFLQEERP